MSAIDKTIDFSVRLDAMKTVHRRTIIIGTDRHEDDAQHSFHIAAMAVLFEKYTNEPVDLERVMTMLLFHDVVELEAGDTYCYDDSLQTGKYDREYEAALALYGSLPDDMNAHLMDLWLEFEARVTPEARFAQALDRSQPIFNNYYGGGGSWIENGIRRSQVLQRIDPVKDGCRPLYDHICTLIDKAVENGWLLEG